jgi:hypothetical protein
VKITGARLRIRTALLNKMLNRPADFNTAGHLLLDGYNPDGRGNRYELEETCKDGHGVSVRSSRYNASEMDAFLSGALFAVEAIREQGNGVDLVGLLMKEPDEEVVALRGLLMKGVAP